MKIKQVFLFLAFFDLWMILPAFNGTLENFRIPLLSEQMQEEGAFSGKKAVFLDSRHIAITGAQVFFKDANLQRQWQIKTEYCLFDKEGKTILSDVYSTIESDGIFIDGDGMDWNLNKKVIVIDKNVTVDIRKNSLKGR